MRRNVKIAALEVRGQKVKYPSSDAQEYQPGDRRKDAKYLHRHARRIIEEYKAKCLDQACNCNAERRKSEPHWGPWNANRDEAQ